MPYHRDFNLSRKYPSTHPLRKLIKSLTSDKSGLGYVIRALSGRDVWENVRETVEVSPEDILYGYEALSKSRPYVRVWVWRGSGLSKGEVDLEDYLRSHTSINRSGTLASLRYPEVLAAFIKEVGRHYREKGELPRVIEFPDIYELPHHGPASVLVPLRAVRRSRIVGEIETALRKVRTFDDALRFIASEESISLVQVLSRYTKTPHKALFVALLAFLNEYNRPDRSLVLRYLRGLDELYWQGENLYLHLHPSKVPPKNLYKYLRALSRFGLDPGVVIELRCGGDTKCAEGIRRLLVGSKK